MKSPKAKPQPVVLILPPGSLKAFENETEPEAGETYFTLREVQYRSTIDPRIVEEGPAWSLTQPLPLAPCDAVTAALPLLKKLVKATKAWPVTAVTLQRLRNSDTARWFYVFQFTRETGPLDLQGVAFIYVAFSGQVGAVSKWDSGC